MKTAGIIGGIGPESTIEYYRQTIALYRERTRDGSYPPLVINSIDVTRMLDLAGTNQRELADYLVRELERLAGAGADFALLAANTPHLVFDALRSRCPIPLISIVEVTCEAAKARGLRRTALLGTKFTMQARFYPDGLAQAGIALVLPSAEEQSYVHEKYMGELVNGLIVPETRARLLAIVERLRAEEAVDGVILGGTELPLILQSEDARRIPFLDTTRLHVERLVAEILS